jgi:branched-subunit amino acid transport protein
MTTWQMIGILAGVTLVARAVGMHGSQLLQRSRLAAVLPYLAPAVIAGLVVSAATGAPDGPGIALDARLAGVVAAAVTIALRWHVLVSIATAMGVAAAVRALTG